jgi:hypothetical protein
LERAVPKLKAKKLNMQPGDAAEYEAEARAYFDSLRQPFEQTLSATQTDRPRIVMRIIMVVGLVVAADFPLLSPRIVNFFFHQNTWTVFGQAYPITEIAGYVLAWCFISSFVLVLGGLGVAQTIEMNRAQRPLSKDVMVFVLSYAIVRELDSFERSKLPHHQQRATELWTKMLTYLRWRFHGISADTAHFHKLPTSDYDVAPNTEDFAKALNWQEVRVPEYEVIVALNRVHQKISPRLKNGNDIPKLKVVFQALGNFFYTTVVERREGEASWGYDELQRAAGILTRMPSIPKRGAPSRLSSLFSLQVFTHPNIAVAIFACWVVVAIIFALLVVTVFRFFPTMTLNSQSLATLITASAAAAIAVVGLSRKKS